MDMFVTSYGHAPVLKLTLPCSDAERFGIAPERQGYVHRGDAHSRNTYIRGVWQTQRDNALTGGKGGRNRELSRALHLL